MKKNFLAVKMLSDQITKISYSRAFALFYFFYFFLFFVQRLLHLNEVVSRKRTENRNEIYKFRYDESNACGLRVFFFGFFIQGLKGLKLAYELSTTRLTKMVA